MSSSYVFLAQNSVYFLLIQLPEQKFLDGYALPESYSLFFTIESDTGYYRREELRSAIDSGAVFVLSFALNYLQKQLSVLVLLLFFC